MNLLQKLNLEPGDFPNSVQRSAIMDAITSNWRTFNRLGFDMHGNQSLTNAEFLAACEEWLAKN